MKLTQEETKYKQILLDLILSATLADHMGDMWDSINNALKEMGEDELIYAADHEYEEVDDDSEPISQFVKLLKEKGAKYSFEK